MFELRVGDGDGYSELAIAIISLAAHDYLEARKYLYLYGEDYTVQNRMADAMIFFKSEWYSALTNVSYKYLLKELNREFDEWRNNLKKKN